MNLEFILAYDHHEEIRELFAEYTDMLVKGEPAFAKYLVKQNYDAEVEHPEMKYGLPGSRLYVAYLDKRLVGCCAIRQIDEEYCEIKRLYVRKEFRGAKIGTCMVERLVSDARKIGYRAVLLDTLPFLKTAIRMYHEYGFYDIPSYNNSPMEGLLYMRYDL